jgi:hypothetical protein
MSAIDTLLDSLIDYAGMYPPARLNLQTAAQNYLRYGRSKHGCALGRFIVDVGRLTDLCHAAGDSKGELKLSVIATQALHSDSIFRQVDDGLAVDVIEIKCDRPSEIERISKQVPSSVTMYFEVPIESSNSEILDAISATGSRAKVRMGGLIPDAFPSTREIAILLKALADRHIPFKATAGLHHPIRSHHRLTYEAGSPTGKMHGFLNLACASALVYSGAEASDAQCLLEEEDPRAWHVSDSAIRWGALDLSTEHLRLVRERFFISFGSCSFEEPMDDLEALGWL